MYIRTCSIVIDYIYQYHVFGGIIYSDFVYY